jgi:pyruvate ferredoxin oxidoreductase alpha subunit
MSEHLDGSRGVARAVGRCRPRAVCVHPVTPPTEISEALSHQAHAGELSSCEFVNAESEFAAMSMAIGASAAGVRAYAATAGQGLLSMAQALFDASERGLPIVMTADNRKLGAPTNTRNDQGDAMALRDCGWIQLYASDSQEAVDLHVQAFRIAEALSLPVMVCMDGSALTHGFEPKVPAQEDVDDFLPAFTSREVLDPDEPITVGTMAGPETFTEVRYLAHVKQLQALELIPTVAADFRNRFGRCSGGLLQHYHSAHAKTVVVTLGSVFGAVVEVVDELRERGHSIGAVALKCFRPLPASELGAALHRAERVIVLERAFAVGAGGIVSADLHAVLAAYPTEVVTAIAGLGGRGITRKSLRTLCYRGCAGNLGELQFLDLKRDILERELAGAQDGGRSGPLAESALRELEAVAPPNVPAGRSKPGARKPAEWAPVARGA